MSFFFSQPRGSDADTFAGGEATIADIYVAAREQMILVDNVNASGAALERAYDERNEEVFTATGFKPENPFRRASSEAQRPDIEGAEQLSLTELYGRAVHDWQQQVDAQAARLPDQMAAAQLTRSINGDAIRIARSADEKLGRLMESNPGMGKWAGALAGGMAGSFRDPVAIGSLFIGGGVGAGRTVAARILSTAMREAFVNGATEAAMQPLVQAWRKQAGLEAGFGEAAKNVGFAALFGGVVGGGAHAISEGAARLSGIDLNVAASELARAQAVDADVRAGLDGDITAAARSLPQIREALPAQARGALDHAEVLDHAERLRPAAADIETHDVNLGRAHRALDAEDQFRSFEPDAAQVARISGELAAPYEAHAPAGKTPVSLVEFLIARGGLIDDGGEIAHIGGEALTKNRAKKGKADKRIHLDHARELAEEAGYIGSPDQPNATRIPDLLDAIDTELRGAKIFAREDMERLGMAQAAGAERARIESAVSQIAAIGGPGLDDRLVREAAELVLTDGAHPVEALEQVFMRAGDAEARATNAEVLPGWSDAELEAVSAGRGDEPFPGDFPDPADYPDDYAISPAELEEFGAASIPTEDGRIVSLADYMDAIKAEEELQSIVKACRA